MSKVRLDPMSKEEYSVYMIDNIRRYAEAGVASGVWREEESLKEAEKSIKELLPKGMRTKNNFFFKIMNKRSDASIGVLWLAVHDKTMTRSVFVYDILIFEKNRHKGFGTETMKEIEAWAKGAGAKVIWLHAFWQNQQAIALYRRLGYTESDVTMRKRISGA